MDKEHIEQEITRLLKEREKRVLNRAAISALFGAFTDPIGALGKIFMGRTDAIEAEKQKIAQNLMLELLCEIDETISRISKKSLAQGVSLSGFIETSANDSGSVVGVNINKNSGPVIIQPGTHIKTEATRTHSVTGLKIGD